MSAINFHRKGKTFQDNGNALVFDPAKQTWEGMYLVQREAKPLRVKKEIRQRMEWLKEERPTEFKTTAEQITIELVKYLAIQNGGEAVDLSTVYQEGAFLLKVSPETMKRYVYAHTAMNAELYRVGKKVKPSPYYKPMSDDEEDDDE
jgi:hypothetical protein